MKVEMTHPDAMADQARRSIRRGSSVSNILEPEQTTETPKSTSGSDPGQRRPSRPGTSRNRQAGSKMTIDNNTENNDSTIKDGININNNNNNNDSNDPINSQNVENRDDTVYNNNHKEDKNLAPGPSPNVAVEEQRDSRPNLNTGDASDRNQSADTTAHQSTTTNVNDAQDFFASPSAASHESTHHYVHRGSNNFTPAANNNNNNNNALNLRSVPKTRNNFTSRLAASRKADPSRLSVMSKTSSYYHGDVVDDNLLLSAARIDSTLLRLFSRSRDATETKKTLESEDKLLPFLNYSESDLISMDAVLWRVHPMEATHKATLEQEMDYLEEHVSPAEVLRRLYMDEVLTHMDYNTITRTEGQGQRAVTRLLMKTLMRRGEKAYPSLISALQAFHYDHVSGRLQDAEKQLRLAMEEERRTSRNLSNSSHLSSNTLIGSSYDHQQHHHHYYYHHHPQNDNKESYDRSIKPGGAISPTRRPATAERQALALRGAATTADGDSTDHGLAPAESETGRSAVVDARKLEEQLNGLNVELKALHEDVTALKTARSQSLATGRNPLNQTTGPNTEVPRAQKSSSCSIF